MGMRTLLRFTCLVTLGCLALFSGAAFAQDTEENSTKTRISGWNAQCISQGRKDTLVCNVEQAIYLADSGQQLAKVSARVSGGGKAPEMVIHLVRNPDILSRVAALDGGRFTVGFAAETDRVEEHAREKLQRKGLDMIAANRVGAERGGFEDDENALLVLWSGGQVSLPMMPKTELAEQLAELIVERLTDVPTN